MNGARIGDSVSQFWQVPLALVAGAALASNPRLFPGASVPEPGPGVSRASAIAVNGPSEDVVSALDHGRKGSESPELRALRLAEGQLFDEQPEGPVFEDGPRDPSDRESARGQRQTDLGFLDGLTLPEFPVESHPAVKKYLDFFTRSEKGRGMLTAWIRRSGRYRDVVTEALERAHLPRDLEAVVYIESGFWPTAKSSAGAVGLWQFMPETARAYGLTVNPSFDERRSIWRSSEAAAKHLSDLYQHFNSWELALAAYNYGYRNLQGKLDALDTNDFWTLVGPGSNLPTETQRYVPKVMAIAVALRNLEEYGFSDLDRDRPLRGAPIDVPPGTNLNRVATAAGLSLAELQRYNPEFLSALVPDRGSPVVLHIPRTSLARAKTMLPRLLGDDFEFIPAEEPLTTPDSDLEVRLARTNPLKKARAAKIASMESDDAAKSSTPVEPSPLVCQAGSAQSSLDDGEKRVASNWTTIAGSAPEAALPDGSVVVTQAELVSFIEYRVQRGDTLAKIATEHAVSEQELLLDNHIRRAGRLLVGDRLIIRDRSKSPIRKDIAYRVRRGDTLSTIALRSKHDAERIARDNGITNPNQIRVGQIVILSPG